jgi:hypothetical protein
MRRGSQSVIEVKVKGPHHVSELALRVSTTFPRSMRVGKSGL